MNDAASERNFAYARMRGAQYSKARHLRRQPLLRRCRIAQARHRRTLVLIDRNTLFYMYLYLMYWLDAVQKYGKPMNLLYIVQHTKQRTDSFKKYLTSNRLSVELKLLQCNIFSFRGDCTSASRNRPET